MNEEKYILPLKKEEINDVLSRATTKQSDVAIGNFPVFSAGRDLADSGKNTSSYALALKTTDGPAGSVEIYPDEGSNIVVTAHGFTEQAGDGDTSPTNIRPISVGGVSENLFDPTLLLPSFKYDPLSSSVSFEAFGDGTNYDWFNGTFGFDAKLNHYMALKPNTQYEVCIESLTGSGIYFSPVGNDGKPSRSNSLYFASGNSLRGFVRTSETGYLTVNSSYPNKGTKVKGLVIEESAFDPSLLYSDVEYDPSTGTVKTPIISSGAYNYYDIFNGTVGVSEKAEKYIQLKPNTSYTIEVTHIDYSTLFVLNVDGSGSVSSPTAGASVGEDRRPQVFQTSNSGRITLRAYSVLNASSYSEIKIKELDSPDLKSIISIIAAEQKNAKLDLRYPLLDSDYADTSGAEVHKKYYVVFTGDENWYFFDNAKYPQLLALALDFYPDGSAILCSHAVNKVGSTTPGSIYALSTAKRIYLNPTGGQWGDILSGWTDDTLIDMWKAWLKQQYESGTPVQVVVGRKEPIVYPHDPIQLPAKPDNTGKITVSGEKTVSATYNKSLSHAFLELQSAIIALGANMQGGL